MMFVATPIRSCRPAMCGAPWRTGAGNVGGRRRPVGYTLFERTVGLAMTDPLGASGVEGPVDTVYLGAFPRHVLESVGGYNPDLARDEDCELNRRLRMRRYRVWYDPELVPITGRAAPCGRWRGSISTTAAGSGPWAASGFGAAAPIGRAGHRGDPRRLHRAGGGGKRDGRDPLAYGLATVAGAAVIGAGRGIFPPPPPRPARGDYDPRVSEPSSPPVAAPAR